MKNGAIKQKRDRQMNDIKLLKFKASGKFTYI